MTTTDAYTLTMTDWQSDCEALYAVRREVFIDEQQVPPELEQDEFDPQSWHAIARDHAGYPIATGRLLPDGHIGRVAVRKPWRGQGIGQAIMVRLLEEAKRQGFTTIKLNAQTQVTEFCLQLGFQIEGAEFMEAGIPHQAMTLNLRHYGVDAYPLDGPQDSLKAALQLLTLTRRHVLIYTPYLHPQIYNAETWIDDLARLVSGQSRFYARLLLPPAKQWRYSCPQFAQLIQRLSALELRVLPDDEPRERPEFHQSFVLGDDTLLLSHHDPRYCRGQFDRHAGLEARQRYSFFMDYWDKSAPEPELRQLGL